MNSRELLQRLVALDTASRHSNPALIGFGTVGGRLNRRPGIAAVVCAPGSIARAHKPVEFAAAAQLDACDVRRNAVAAGGGRRGLSGR